MFSEMPALLLVLVAAVLSGSYTSAATSSGEDQNEGPLLSTFKGVHRELTQHPDGTYRFSFSLPQQERHESRDEDGKVTGSFAFVDNVGEEVSVKYNADDQGFRPESDALPEIPEDTDDVQSAREEFLRYYEQTVKFLKELGSDEDSDEDSDDSSSSSEESDEYDDEDDEEESDEDDSDDDSDSESDEDSEEEDSDEDDDDEEDEENEGGEVEDDEEEEEEEGSESISKNFFRFSPQRRSNSIFGSRIKQQDLSRTAPAKQEEEEEEKETTKAKAVFPPPLPAAAASSVFGRRTSVKSQ